MTMDLPDQLSPADLVTEPSQEGARAAARRKPAKALHRSALAAADVVAKDSVPVLRSDVALTHAADADNLPVIPAKRYFTIGEVSELCGVKPYVLRYWEQEFTQLRPMKRRGNRRYYQHHEVLLIRRIRGLLYEQGFTISGARNQLHDVVPAAALGDAAAEGHAPVSANELLGSTEQQDAMALKWAALRDAAALMPKEALSQLRDSLLDIRAILDAPVATTKDKAARS
jgi:DNA-binding transcriptional MerR regulator